MVAITVARWYGLLFFVQHVFICRQCTDYYIVIGIRYLKHIFFFRRSITYYPQSSYDHIIYICVYTILVVVVLCETWRFLLHVIIILFNGFCVHFSSDLFLFCFVSLLVFYTGSFLNIQCCIVLIGFSCFRMSLRAHEYVWTNNSR